MEKELIMSMLQKADYNKKKAAELLNMSRKTLYNKIEKYGISMR
jgi:two-component system response regulator HydG